MTGSDPTPAGHPDCSSKLVAVLRYGSGNVHSAVKALATTGARVVLTADPEVILVADGLVVPGVGAFGAVMEQLQTVSGAELIRQRLAAGKPVLGICVGEQIMFETGIERDVTAAGLGYLSGTVQQLRSKTLPHMGWNTVTAPAHSVLLQGLQDAMFYFVHSNAATRMPRALLPELSEAELRVAWAEHENQKFIAAFEVGALSATQFHPEKSAAAGLKLLKNWVAAL